MRGRAVGPTTGLSQAIATREELHTQCARSLQDKDALRKQVRELSEKADELQLLLFQREGQLLAAEGRLKRQQLEMLILVRLPGALLQGRGVACLSGAGSPRRPQSLEEELLASLSPGLARPLPRRPREVLGLPEPPGMEPALRSSGPSRRLRVWGGEGEAPWRTAGLGPRTTSHRSHSRGGSAPPQPADRPLFCDHRAPTWRTAHPGTPRR